MSTCGSASHVSVLFSRHDDVLRRHFPHGEAISQGKIGAQPLGMLGSSRADSPQLPAGGVTLSNCDVSATVPGHNPNQWLLSPAVMACIAGSRCLLGSLAGEPLSSLPKGNEASRVAGFMDGGSPWDQAAEESDGDDDEVEEI